MDGKALRTYHTLREARSTGTFSKASSTNKQQQQQRAEKQRGGSFVKSEHWGMLTVTILEGRNLCGQSTQKEASIVLKVDNDEETMSTSTYCAAPIIIWDETFTFNISHKHFTLSLALWRRKKKKGASGKVSRELNFGQSALEPWIEQGWLNLDGQEGSSQHAPGAGRAPPKCLSLRIVFKPTKVFGVPLKVLCDRYRRAVPPILEDIALFYRSTKPDLMELFRKPPQESDLHLVESWVTAYDHGETNVDLHKCKVSGTVRLLLVKFLRELPDSLIPKSHYRDWIAITEIADEHEKREKLSSLLSALPRHNLLSLCKLILCLRHVQENSKGQSADKFPILTMASLSRSSSSASFYHPSSPVSSVYAASPPSPTSSSSALEDMTQHQQHVSNSLSHLSSYSCPEKLPHVPWGFLFGSCILVPDSFGEADGVKQVQDIIQFLFENSGYVLDKQWMAEAETPATRTKRKPRDADDAADDEDDEEEDGEKEKEKEKEKEGGGGDDDDFFFEDDASVLTFKPGTSFLFLFSKEESEEDLQQQLLQMAEEDEQANALNELEKKRIQTKKKKRKVRRKGQRRLETRIPVGAEHSSPASIAKHAAEEEALALERERKKKSIKLEKKRGTMLGLWDDASTATSSNNLLTDCSSSSTLSLSSNANSFSSSASCIDFSSSAASSSSASNSSASSPGRNSPVEEMMMMAEHNNALHPFNNSNSASNKNSPRLTLRKIRSISIGKSSKKNKVANNKEGGGSGSSPLHSPTSIEKQSMVAINFAPDPRKIVGGGSSSSTFIGTDYSTSKDRRIPALGGITIGDANHTMIMLNKPPRNEGAGNRGSGALASITLSSSGNAVGEGNNNSEQKKTKKEKKKEKREKKKQQRLIKSKSSRSMRSSLEVDASSSQSLRPPPKRQDSGGSLTSSSKDKKTKKGQTVAERSSTGRVPLEGLFVDANPSAKEKKRSPVLSAYTVRPSSSSSSSSSSKASLSSFISPRNLRPVSPYANFNNSAVPLSHSSDSVHFRPSHSSASSSSSNPSSSSSSPTTSYASFPSSASSNESSVSPSLASSASSSLTVSFAPPPGEENEAQDGRGRRRTNVPPSQILSENEMQSLAKTLSMFKSDSYSSSNEETSEWAEAGDYGYDEEGAYYEGGDGYYEQQEEPEFYEEEDSSGYWEEEEEEEEEGEDNTLLNDQSIAITAKDGLPNIRVSTVIQDGDGEDEDKRTRVVMFQTSGSTGYFSLSAPSLSLNNNNGTSNVEQKEGSPQLLPTIKRPPRPVVRRHTESAPSLRSFSLSPTTPINNPPSRLSSSSSSSSSSSEQATDTSTNNATTPSPKRPPRPVRRSNNLTISPLSKSTITPPSSSLNPTKPSANSSLTMSPSSSSSSHCSSSSSSSSPSSSSEVVVVTTAPVWAPPSQQQQQSSPRTASANTVPTSSQHQQQQRRRIVPISREEEAFYESILIPPEVGSDFHEILAYFEHLCEKQPRRASVMLRARSYAYNNNKT